jgi:hypothetical protein
MNRSMNNLNRMYKRAELSDRVRFTNTNGRQAEGVVVSRQGRGGPGSTFKVKMANGSLKNVSENKVVTVLGGKRSTRKNRKSSRSKSRKN